MASKSERLERLARLELEEERLAATVARAAPSTEELTERAEREREGSAPAASGEVAR